MPLELANAEQQNSAGKAKMRLGGAGVVDSKAQGSRASAVSLVHTAEGGSLGRTSSCSLL